MRNSFFPALLSCSPSCIPGWGLIPVSSWDGNGWEKPGFMEQKGGELWSWELLCP